MFVRRLNDRTATTDTANWRSLDIVIGRFHELPRSYSAGKLLELGPARQFREGRRLHSPPRPNTQNVLGQLLQD